MIGPNIKLRLQLYYAQLQFDANIMKSTNIRSRGKSNKISVSTQNIAFRVDGVMFTQILIHLSFLKHDMNVAA